jgi:predicted nucleic acid-binding protein
MTTASAERVFADTNVLVYLIAEDTRKAEKAAEILKCAPVISVQILNEFVSVARRKHKKAWQDVLAVTATATEECTVVALTLETHERAALLAEAAQVDIYDACIVAAAELSGCDVLYTEDLNHGQRIGGVEIRNPFL